jgi:uncharacterized membrane protein YqjE
MATSIAAAPARVSASPTETEQLPVLISRLGDDVMELVDTKIGLLKVEIKEEANTFIHGGVMIAIGGVIAALGFALANVAVALAVSTLFANTGLSQTAQYALGFVSTGLLYLVVGGIIVMVMKSRLAQQQLVPQRTVEEIRKDAQWLKKEL